MWAYIGVVRNRRREVAGDQWQRACRPCFKRLDAKGGDHNLSNCLCIRNVIVKLYSNCSVGSEGGAMLLEDQRKLPGRGHWNRCLKMNRSLAVKEGEYGHSRQRNVLRPGAVVWIYVSPLYVESPKGNGIRRWGLWEVFINIPHDAFCSMQQAPNKDFISEHKKRKDKTGGNRSPDHLRKTKLYPEFGIPREGNSLMTALPPASFSEPIVCLLCTVHHRASIPPPPIPADSPDAALV